MCNKPNQVIERGVCKTCLNGAVADRFRGKCVPVCSGENQYTDMNGQCRTCPVNTVVDKKNRKCTPKLIVCFGPA